MQQFQQKTDITIKNSFLQTQFIDWRTQPKSFKTYPKFFRRYPLDEFEELKFIKDFGKITEKKVYGNEEVVLRATPSAGALYPCEIYIQIRGIKNLLSGIYHYEPLNDSLTLIHELSNDGLEYYFETDSKKFIFLISNVYFRTSWKYENRAIRYLLLDTGHQLGAICSALKKEAIPFDFSFNFNKKRLNEAFGFEEQEFFQGAILVDNEKDTKYKNLRERLVTVSPTDYFIKNHFLEEFSKLLENLIFDEIKPLHLLDDIDKKSLQRSINKRRSIRVFEKKPITKEEFDFLTKDIFERSKSLGIEVFFINNNVKNLELGVYKNVNLVSKGDFKGLSTRLAFNQKLGESSCFTLIFTSKKESNLFQDYIISGFLAHIINLRATSLAIGCSGIGAFFDDECQRNLKTTNNILYLQAVGR
ncbi:hypothetical protein CRV08_06890 [Halarcobacter ebronensis]|uniref:Nitroreductase domain-containing protein n=1 Tax=Halarcobacter ebronensis TaxID=1462615 RepID=A0A4Q0YHI0_9BACT|nr:hypothetical protein [Halarcobacter ebronensis]RXJ68549.1 hypothetical protein CRV08_06890 [Halarcobacter ebronensis]